MATGRFASPVWPLRNPVRGAGMLAAFEAYSHPMRWWMTVITSVALGLVVALTASVASLAFAPPASAAAPPHHDDVATIGSHASQLQFTLTPDGSKAFVPNEPNFAARTIEHSPLLLFLAATRATPSDYQQFLAQAKAGGYHVLALDYWNTGKSVEKTCGRNADCYTALQQNRLTGAHPTAFSSVSSNDSIVSRLRNALGYLRTADSHGGWQRYLHGSTINWRRIVVAGHSQGGGESAYIAHIHRVYGALFFSSPVDTTHGVSASWMKHRGATPASRMYAFVDRGDIFYDRIRGSWKELGMNSFGAPADAASRVPFSSHEVVSYRDLGRPGQSHLRTITDKTPRTPGGQPAFSTVWRWMLAQLYTPPTAAPQKPGVIANS
jgi:hypothetical protein